MNEHAKRWVAALRSGEFKQGRGRLKRIIKRITPESGDVRYCCLGVACEVYRREVGGTWTNDAHFLPPDGRGRPGGIFLPAPVAEWLGLSRASGALAPGAGRSLTSLNDDGASFEKIADVIESEPEGLFEGDSS